MRNVKNLTICVLVLALVSTAAGTTLYVPSGAYPTIQAAINAAVSGEDQIEVAPGTYIEAINFKNKAIRLYSSGGPGATTIDATGLGSSVVTCNSGEGADTMLEGFTIKGGTAVNGGGMYNTGSSPMVLNCVFTGNAATGGGGMDNENSSPTITNCSFTSNTASGGGGGMRNAYSSNPTVTNCTFTTNSADTHGGGLVNVLSSSPTLTNCVFSGNEAGGHGGGMINSVDCSPEITNCTFSGNTAFVDGGGMFNGYASNSTVTNCTFTSNLGDRGGGMYNYQSSPTLTNCTFSGNTATYGGGMYCDQSSATITDCRFLGNSAENSPDADTGAVMSVNGSLQLVNCIFSGNTAVDKAGAVYCLSSDTSTIVNCAFIGNSSKFGGGVFTYSGATPTLINCTFSGNSASAPNGGGAMFIFYHCHAVVKNCIFWGDTPNEIINIDNSTTTATYSDVEGGYPGTGNIDADPLFDDADGRLLAASPCIDAGNNAAVPTWLTTDLDGNPRIQGGWVDMGAFEVEGPEDPETVLGLLRAYILQQVALGNIDVDLEGGLLDKVDAASQTLARGNPNNAKPAMNNMKALINQVEAQTGKKIEADAAEAIIGCANAIVAALGG